MSQIVTGKINLTWLHLSKYLLVAPGCCPNKLQNSHPHGNRVLLFYSDKTNHVSLIQSYLAPPPCLRFVITINFRWIHRSSVTRIILFNCLSRSSSPATYAIFKTSSCNHLTLPSSHGFCAFHESFRLLLTSFCIATRIISLDFSRGTCRVSTLQTRGQQWCPVGLTV